ncbi:MAG: type II secretion system protein GspD [Planctomycetota bacterium]
MSPALATLLILGSCVSGDPPTTWGDPVYEFATFDEKGRQTPGTETQALAQQIWGLGDKSLLEERGAEFSKQAASAPEVESAQDPEQQERTQEQERRRREAMIRSTFGSEVIIGQDGRITKRYSLGIEAGPVFRGLLTPFSTGAIPEEVKAGTTVGGEDLDSVLGRMLGPDHAVELVYLPDFEVIYNMPLTPTAQPNMLPVPPIKANEGIALLLVTAQPSALLAFEQALNLFFAHMPQVEIDVQVVEYSTNDSLSFGIERIDGADGTTPVLDNLSSGQLIRDITGSFPLTGPLGSAATDKGLISLGGIHDSWALNATLQVLETNGIADIKNNPKLVVRNGGLATVITKTEVPYPKSQILGNNNNLVSTDIVFKEVGITLHIRPEIAGTDTVILQINATVSAVVGFADTDPVPTPIVASREAATTVHLRAGQTTVIGGLVSDTTFENESKIPILGDIPIVGYLFRSSTTQEQRTVLEFFVTPRVLRGPQGFSPEGLSGQ